MEAANSADTAIARPSARPPTEVATVVGLTPEQAIVLPSSLAAPQAALANAIIAQAASRHAPWFPQAAPDVEFATMEKGIDGVHQYALSEGFAVSEKKKEHWGNPKIVRMVIFHCCQGGSPPANIPNSKRKRESKKVGCTYRVRLSLLGEVWRIVKFGDGHDQHINHPKRNTAELASLPAARRATQKLADGVILAKIIDMYADVNPGVSELSINAILPRCLRKPVEIEAWMTAVGVADLNEGERPRIGWKSWIRKKGVEDIVQRRVNQTGPGAQLPAYILNRRPATYIDRAFWIQPVALRSWALHWRENTMMGRKMCGVCKRAANRRCMITCAMPGFEALAEWSQLDTWITFDKKRLHLANLDGELYSAVDAALNHGDGYLFARLLKSVYTDLFEEEWGDAEEQKALTRPPPALPQPSVAELLPSPISSGSS